jgi:phosphatidylethanolamine-binding protein
MFFSSVLVVLAGAATAFTPAGFEPASSNNLTVVFGNTLATNGKNILKAGKLFYQNGRFISL